MGNIAYSCNICNRKNMNDEPNGALNLRNFPKDLIRLCRIKALNQKMTLRQFVEKVLREAVDDKGKRAKTSPASRASGDR